jgi:hypothetical protein
MQHPQLVEFEKRLKKLFDSIDDRLETRYGKLYPLHPSRAPRGTTSNKEQDGLFNIGASFSAGFGSRVGKGYVLDVRMVTLAHVPDYVRDEIIEDAVRSVQERLPYYFPDRDLSVVHDHNVFKIRGDLSLGDA